jgi:uncharacterized repeat protein (TIGR02543 family)
MDGNKTVTATFTQLSYTLTVNTNGEGSVTRDPDLPEYPSGTDVTLTAEPAAGWEFSGWSVDASGTGPSVVVTMDGNKTVTATFTQLSYTLTVNTNGEGSVTRDPDLPEYPSGTDVTLTAEPAAGWEFSGWSVDASGTGPSVVVTMDGNKTVTATFTQLSYTLAVNTSGEGSVTRDPDLPEYPSGTDVTLTAEPAAGWEFSGWSVDASGTGPSVVVTMDGDKPLPQLSPSYPIR